MEENTSNLAYYIYTIDNDRYYVYIGITKNEENLDKLKGYFDSLGYNIYVKEFYISSESFITVLDQYETMLSETNDSKTIGSEYLPKDILENLPTEEELNLHIDIND